MAGLSAMLAAAMMIAQQVAGKSTRDAFFLTEFPVDRLPPMLVGSALLSIVVAMATARALSRVGPGRFVPAAFAVSAVLLGGIWLQALRAPSLAAVGLFLHIAVVGPVLISGYWSLFNESFDPRAAKRQIVRVGGIGTLGGVLGGLLAERVATTAGIVTMLPVLAAMHAVCAVIVRGLGRSGPPDSAAPEGDLLASVRLLRRRPYLRDLALLVALGTTAAALLDYVFKVYATEAFGEGGGLVRVFSSFYSAVALITFVTQVTLSRLSLDRLRVAEIAGLLPLSVIGGATGVLVAPGLLAAGIARGFEVVVRNSLFRSGYELLYTPVAPEEKRATKAVVDVGAERLGDAIGGALVAGVLALGLGGTVPALLVLALGLAVVGLWVTRRLHRGYVRALQSNLVRSAVPLEAGAPADLSQTWVSTMVSLRIELPDRLPNPSRADLDVTLPPLPAARPAAPPAGSRLPPAAAPPPPPTTTTSPAPAAVALEGDTQVARVADLRSGDPRRIHEALTAGLTPELVAYAIPLLSREETAGEAVRALRRIAPRVTGQLVDALLDPDRDVAVRRRLPRVLGECRNERAVQGLFAALEDPRFEVRQQAGRSLARIRERAPELVIARERAIAAVLREVDVDRAVWEGRRELARTDASTTAPLETAVLRERADQSIEHVFTLLSLAIGQLTLLRIAIMELKGGDPARRGNALEYLEVVMPPEVREKLWPFLEEPRAPGHPPRPPEEVVERLLSSHQSMRMRLDALRGRSGEAPDEES